MIGIYFQQFLVAVNPGEILFLNDLIKQQRNNKWIKNLWQIY